jgi:predicted DNA-binding protein
MTTSPYLKNVSVWVEPTLAEKIERIAKTEKRTKASYLREALEQYYSQYPDPKTPA